MADPICTSLLVILEKLADSCDCVTFQGAIAQVAKCLPEICCSDILLWHTLEPLATTAKSSTAQALILDDSEIAGTLLGRLDLGAQGHLLFPVEEAEPSFAPVPQLNALLAGWKAAGAQHVCAIPLARGKRRSGCVLFAAPSAAAFSGHVLREIHGIASFAAMCWDDKLQRQQVDGFAKNFQREGRRLQTLLEVNNSLVSNLEREKLVEKIVVVLREVLGAEYSAVTIYNSETESLEWLTLHLPGEMWKSDFGLDFLLRMNELLVSNMPDALWLNRLAELARRDEYSDVAVYNSVSKQLCWLGLNDSAHWMQHASEVVRSSEKPLFVACRKIVRGRVHIGFSIPLVTHGNIVGVLNVSHKHEESSHPDEALLLHDIAGQVALAVDNTLAYHKIMRLKDKLANEKLYLEEEIRRTLNPQEIIGTSAILKKAIAKADMVADSNSTVLLLGETGTGKELFARYLHSMSQRRGRTLVKVNCAAIPSGLLESELFGHEKGAYTGATTSRMGRFELANQGTLFLDEIGELPAELQPKLLHAIQEKEFERVGSSRPIKSDVRIVAATNRDLEGMVAEGKFRADLYYRLNVFPIVIPPLRERREDIPLLVRYFMARFSKQMKRQIESILPETMEALQNMPWKGNVRELQNIIERAVILTHGPALNVPLGELSTHPSAPVTSPSPMPVENRTPASENIFEIERQHILKVLNESHGIVGGPHGAAVRLGLKRSTLVSRMRRLGITRGSFN